MTAHDPAAHWQTVYDSKAPEAVSWFRPHLNVSLELLKRAGLHAAARVIDIGAGASTLVDDLLALGVRNVIAVDISEAALRISRQRLGPLGARITWKVSNVTSLDLPPDSIDIWHDRAALHFLTDDRDVQAYVRIARRAIAPGGYAIVAGFAANGPTRCSGLPVARRDVNELAQLFSDGFVLVEGRNETHFTPAGQAQSFAYALLKHGALQQGVADQLTPERDLATKGAP